MRLKRRQGRSETIHRLLLKPNAGGFPPINDQGQQVATTDPTYVSVKDQIISSGQTPQPDEPKK